ncbi:thioredoxin fold domain-containing protein [Acinetobacter baumannii]|nr:thioredoxin fold domain-containing protein [Acinetobacter baumannii]
MQSIDNVTIYTFLYPLESIHPTAKTTAVSIWCSKNPGKHFKIT